MLPSASVLSRLWIDDSSSSAAPTGDDAHTYSFRLTAVDTTLELDAGADRAALDDALSGHVVDSVVLTGTYER